MVVLALVIAALLLFLAWREHSSASERSELLQRIQAPEIAIREHAPGIERPRVKPVPVDDDQAFVAAREGLNGQSD